MLNFLLYVFCFSLSFNHVIAFCEKDVLVKHLEMSSATDADFFVFREDDFDVNAGHCDPRYSPLTLEFTATLTEIGLPVASAVTLTFTPYAIDREGNFFTGSPVTLDFPLSPGFSGLPLSPVVVKRPLIGNYTVGYFVTVSTGTFAETAGLALSGSLFGTIKSRVEYAPIPLVIAPYAILNAAAVNVSSNFAFKKPLPF